MNNLGKALVTIGVIGTIGARAVRVAEWAHKNRVTVALEGLRSEDVFIKRVIPTLLDEAKKIRDDENISDDKLKGLQMYLLLDRFSLQFQRYSLYPGFSQQGSVHHGNKISVLLQDIQEFLKEMSLEENKEIGVILKSIQDTLEEIKKNNLKSYKSLYTQCGCGGSLTEREH